jgi:hypothetical protein
MIKDFFANLIRSMKDVIPADQTYQSLVEDDNNNNLGGNLGLDQYNEDSYLLNDDLK